MSAAAFHSAFRCIHTEDIKVRTSVKCCRSNCGTLGCIGAQSHPCLECKCNICELLLTWCVQHLQHGSQAGRCNGTFSFAPWNQAALICISITSLTALSWAELSLRWTLSEAAPKRDVLRYVQLQEQRESVSVASDWSTVCTGFIWLFYYVRVQPFHRTCWVTASGNQTFPDFEGILLWGMKWNVFISS